MKSLVLLALAIGTLAQYEEGKNPSDVSPVTRVVKMLETLEADIKADAVSETLIYRKFACWCVDTSGKIANDIHVARDDMQSMQTDILELRSLIEQRTQEIAVLEQEIKDNLEAQEQATALRQKEHADHEAVSAETQQALNALTRAIDVLKAGTSFLQASAARSEVAKVVNALPVTASLNQKNIAMLSEFMKADSKYAPQSMTVQGILKDMFATFATNLMKGDREEAISQKLFEELIAAKQKRLSEAREDKQNKENEKAEAEKEEAETQKQYDATKEQMEIDIKFFDETAESCTSKKNEWVTRCDDREAELKGVQEAIRVLTCTENRALFADSIKPGQETIQDSNVRDDAVATVSLLQTESSTGAALKAFNALKALARKTHSVRYASLAAMARSAKSGHFDAVIKAIDEVLDELSREESADIEKRDDCKKEYTDLTSTQNDLKWKIKNNIAFIEKMVAQMKAIKARIAEAYQERNDTDQAMKDMEQTRNDEHEAFNKAKENDEKSIEQLKFARTALEKNNASTGGCGGSAAVAEDDEEGQQLGGGGGMALLQKQEPVFEVSDRQAPDATFSKKNSRKGQSNNAVSMLTMIIEDLEDEIKQGIASENKAQYEYEKAMDEAQAKIDGLDAEIAQLNLDWADRNQQKSDEEDTKGQNEKDLKTADDRFAEIKPDCDWMLNSFEQRAVARKAEKEGLIAAKEYLAGASTGLIQKSKNSFEQIGFVHLH